MSPITIVGSIGYDDIESPYGKVERTLGGAAAYAALVAACFTSKINLVSIIGQDFRPEDLALFQNRKINTSGIEKHKTQNTLHWSGLYSQDMNTRQTRFTELNALGDFKPVLPPAYQATKVLLLANLSPVVQKQVIEQFKVRPRHIILDTMNYWITSMPSALWQVMQLVDYLVINDEEAQMLAGEVDLLKAGALLNKRLPKATIVIKQGNLGCLLFNAHVAYKIQAIRLDKVHDPTGAGDSFAGGIAGFLAQSSDSKFATLQKSLLYATVAASFCVEEFGLKGLLKLTQTRLEKRLQDNLTHLQAYVI